MMQSVKHTTHTARQWTTPIKALPASPPAPAPFYTKISQAPFTSMVKHGIIPNKERGGYDWYSNGEWRGWAKYLRDIQKTMKNPPVVLIYPNGKKEKVNF